MIASLNQYNHNFAHLINNMAPYKLKEIRRFKIGLCQSITSLLVLGLIFFVGDWIAKIAMAVLCIAPGFWLAYSWQGYRWLRKQTNECYALVIDENGMQMGYDNGDVVLSWDKISGVRFLRKKVEDGGRLGVLVVIQKDGEEVIFNLGRLRLLTIFASEGRYGISVGVRILSWSRRTCS